MIKYFYVLNTVASALYGLAYSISKNQRSKHYAFFFHVKKMKLRALITLPKVTELVSGGVKILT